MKKNETQDLLDLTLHPVRMRILMLLSGSQGLTPQQMAEQMSDIPQATLYRHINRLARGGLLEVAAERPVRGTLEKVYALSSARQSGPPGEDALEQLNRMSTADHQRFFTTFALSLMDDFARYLHAKGGGPVKMADDGVGYHKLALFLSDEELAGFAQALNQAIAPYLGLVAGPGRKKRLFATVMMPAAQPGETDFIDENKE